MKLSKLFTELPPVQAPTRPEFLTVADLIQRLKSRPPTMAESRLIDGFLDEMLEVLKEGTEVRLSQYVVSSMGTGDNLNTVLYLRPY